MQKYSRYLMLLLSILFLQNTYGQEIPMNLENAPSHHHSPIDVFSGSGDETIICYKEAHRNIYFLVTGLIIIIALVAIKLLLLNKKTNKLLKVQNDIIAEKNKSITDSITYAKRLQNAILPASVVTEKLPEHFILYQPKDIVSGDFYWVSHHYPKFMVAAVDCTGHGVPGALLSIVGHNAISQTVNELGITQPDKVLNSMNALIKNVLHQDKSSDIRDGMDMALCTFDRSTNILEFAGANNPLYIVSNGQLSIIKGARLSVGSVEEVVTMHTNHTIQLKAGDCFYIFSDGYADQFGGDNNKKYKTSRLRELLLSVNSKPMSLQKQLINEAFVSWKGSYEQVDDVLVIGIRV